MSEMLKNELGTKSGKLSLLIPRHTLLGDKKRDPRNCFPKKYIKNLIVNTHIYLN